MVRADPTSPHPELGVQQPCASLYALSLGDALNDVSLPPWVIYTMLQPVPLYFHTHNCALTFSFSKRSLQRSSRLEATCNHNQFVRIT